VLAPPTKLAPPPTGMSIDILAISDHNYVFLSAFLINFCSSHFFKLDVDIMTQDETTGNYLRFILN
jgi:hypothetical protein